MTMANKHSGCPPLRVWSRIEPRTRKVDFERVLRFEFHDAPWNMGRQWQFGEFKGEDTGSAIFAKIAMRTEKLKAFRNLEGRVEEFDDSIPLEVRVERVPIKFDVRTRAQAGRYFLSILNQRGQNYNEGGYTPQYDREHYRSLFRGLFAFELPVEDGDDPRLVVAQQSIRSNARVYQFLSAIVGRAIDGVALYETLPQGTISWALLPSEFAVDVVPEHADFVIEALKEYRDWFNKLYQVPSGDKDTAWNASQLEYQFECHLPHKDGNQVVLNADEYYSGRLEWYSFDVGHSWDGSEDEELGGSTQVKTFSVIPTPAEFPGMPSARLFESEDGRVDLCNINVDSTDVVKIIVSEFALLYGNNWLTIPCSQGVGSLAEIEGIVVTDVFGQQTLVRPATENASADWTMWDFFSLSSAIQANGTIAQIGTHLFLPPTVAKMDESQPIESVSFLRDEMTNTVWGVESIVPDGLGGGRNGNDTARQLRNALEQYEEKRRGSDDVASGSGFNGAVDAEEPPMLSYMLTNKVPENWIPFIAVHKPREDRAIRLQRASMPRFFLEKVRPVRPVTEILRPGLDERQRQLEPYFIHEEEVPRTGVVVEARYQRTRWFNGATFLCIGRRKKNGRGEGGSGLRFDIVKDTQVADSDRD